MITRFDQPAGTTIHFPFCSYDASGQSVSMTGFALSDILVYKDGGTTARASTAGYTLLDGDGTDFASVVGLNGFSISLADNTIAGFYSVGGQYWVVVSSVSVSGQNVTFIAGWFRIIAAEATVGFNPLATDSVNAAALAADAVDEILDDPVVGSTTLRQLIRLFAATLGGKADGLGTSTVHYRNITDTRNAVTATVDASGNRTAVTLDLADP